MTMIYPAEADVNTPSIPLVEFIPAEEVYLVHSDVAALAGIALILERSKRMERELARASVPARLTDGRLSLGRSEAQETMSGLHELYENEQQKRSMQASPKEKVIALSFQLALTMMLEDPTGFRIIVENSISPTS